MAAVGKITLDKSEYVRQINEVKSLTVNATDEMSKGFKSYGTEVNKAGIAMRFVSAELGGQIVSLGRAFQVLAAGKIAMIVAAIGAAYTGLKKAIDLTTVSQEEMNQALDARIQTGNKELEQLRTRQSEEDGYIERLKELSERELKTSEEQDEAAKLTKILSDRYSDLGISVNKTTGEFADLETAIRKLNAAQREQALEKIAEQIAMLQQKSDALAKKNIGGNLASSVWEFFGGTSTLAKSNREEYLKKDTAGKLEYANNMVSGGAKTEESIRFWAEQVEALTEIKNLEERMDKLKKQGAETDKEITEIAKKRTEEATRAAEKELADIERLAEAEAQREAEREKAAQKERDDYAKMLNDEEKLAKANKKRLDDQRIGLRFMAMNALGMNKQSAVDEALFNEANARGTTVAALTPDVVKSVTDTTLQRLALQEAMQASTSAELYAPRVNSLIARGGSYAPVKMPKVEELQSKQLSVLEKTSIIANQILRNTEDWNTI